MSHVPHQRDFQVSLAWVNDQKPFISTPGSYTPDWDLTATYSALTSVALPVEGLSWFNANPNLRRVNRQTGKRHRSTLDTFNDTKGSIPGVTLSMPATKEVLDLFLFMAFQRVTEGGITPYVKNFEFPTTVALWSSGGFPQFYQNEGAFCALYFSGTAGSGYSGNERVLLSAVPSQLRITCASGQHEGQLWLEVDMIARYIDTSASYTGTITQFGVEPSQYFHIQDLTRKTVTGVTGLPLYGFGFTIDTGLQFVPFPGTGSYDMVMAPNASGFVDFLGDAHIDGEVALQNLEESLFTTAFSTATNSIGWSDGTVSTDGELQFDWQMQVTNIQPVGSSELRFRADFDCAEVSSNDALTVDFANAIDRGW